MTQKPDNSSLSDVFFTSASDHGFITDRSLNARFKDAFSDNGVRSACLQISIEELRLYRQQYVCCICAVNSLSYRFQREEPIRRPKSGITTAITLATNCCQSSASVANLWQAH
jgi:hypothetical protein